MYNIKAERRAIVLDICAVMNDYFKLLKELPEDDISSRKLIAEDSSRCLLDIITKALAEAYGRGYKECYGDTIELQKPPKTKI